MVDQMAGPRAVTMAVKMAQWIYLVVPRALKMASRIHWDVLRVLTRAGWMVVMMAVQRAGWMVVTRERR